MKIGDIFGVPAGSAFYLANIGEGQRLHIITSIDTSESLGLKTFQVGVNGFCSIKSLISWQINE